MQPLAILQSIVLLTLANGTPVVAKKIFANFLSHPLDFGLMFLDVRPLFGSSKTVRGVLLSILITTAAAPLVGLPPKIGALIAATAMVGDLFSSFVKRRVNMQPSSQAIGLDQVPESLFPLLVCGCALSLSAADIGISVGIFFAGELIFSRILYRIHLRDEPY
jgi:CDP-2,3-bis-(O-geranylgeranyl)-sn-glycerol synthase